MSRNVYTLANKFEFGVVIHDYTPLNLGKLRNIE